MTQTRRCPRHAVLVLVGVLLTGCATRLPIDERWIEVRTQNFSITSAMSEARTVELARSLEVFRSGVLRLTNVESPDAPVPTRIYLFDSAGSFGPFSPDPTIVGYFMPTVRANFVAIAQVPQVDTSRILKHEYVHFLVRSGSPRVHPHWYEEGFAELLSTMNVESEHLVVGGIPEDRIRELEFSSWLPLHRIMHYDGSQRWQPVEVAMFYAQSWALVHYLTRDQERRVAITKAMSVYVELLQNGTSQPRASESAFGKTTSELDGSLRDYLRKGSFSPFGVPLKRIEWPKATEVSDLSRAEAAVRLGELALLAGKVLMARTLFEAALVEEPDNARAHAGLGGVLAAAELWEEARPHLETAVEIAPDDPLNELDLGAYWQARAAGTEEAELRRKMLIDARRHYERSADLDDGRPEPFARYGESFLVEGEDPSRGIKTLEHAVRLLPSAVEVRLSLAEAYVGAGREEDARPLLRRILAWAHDEEMADRARELLESLDGDGDTRAGPE